MISVSEPQSAKVEAGSDSSRPNRFSRYRMKAGWLFLGLVLICGTVIPAYRYFIAQSKVTVVLDSEVGGKLKVYWATPKEAYFSEKRQAARRFSAGRQELQLSIDVIGPGSMLRIDPLEHPGTVTVLGVEVDGRLWRSDPMQDGVFDPETIWEADGTLEDFGYTEGNGIRMVSNGGDPNLVLSVLPAGMKVEEAQVVASLIVLGLFTLPLWWRIGGRTLKVDWSLLPVLVLALAFGHLVSIALYSHRSAHPDEEVHLKAAGYYEENWVMPSIDDPEIQGSFSTYGYSRLNGSEIVYFLAGKFGEAASLLQIEDEHVKFRLFNLGLFLVLILLAVRDRKFRFILLPVSAFPQAWYLFSYFNSDGFALFLCLLACYHCVAQDGYLVRRDANQPQMGFGGWLSLILIGGCLGMVKPNFWPFTGFLVGFLLVRDFPARATLIKVSVLVASAFVFFGVWKTVANAKNEWRHNERIAEKAAQIALPKHNIAGDLAEMSPGLLLRERGVGLGEMLREWQWFYRTYCSSLGSYSWLNVNPPKRHYDLLMWSYGTASVVVLLQFLWTPSWRQRLIVAGAAFSMFALILASILHSWTSDFQAQGRYLAAVLPILGLAMMETRRQELMPALYLSMLFIWVGGMVSLSSIAVARLVAGG